MLSEVRDFLAKHILSIRGQTLELKQFARRVTCTGLYIAETMHDKVSARTTLQEMRLIQSKAYYGIDLLYMIIGICRYLCRALFPCCPNTPRSLYAPGRSNYIPNMYPPSAALKPRMKQAAVLRVIICSRGDWCYSHQKMTERDLEQ